MNLLILGIGITLFFQTFCLDLPPIDDDDERLYTISEIRNNSSVSIPTLKSFTGIIHDGNNFFKLMFWPADAGYLFNIYSSGEHDVETITVSADQIQVNQDGAYFLDTDLGEIQFYKNKGVYKGVALLSTKRGWQELNKLDLRFNLLPLAPQKTKELIIKPKTPRYRCEVDKENLYKQALIYTHNRRINSAC